MCKLIWKRHRVLQEQPFITLDSGKAAENFIIKLKNLSYSQCSRCWEKTHNSFFFTSAERSHGFFMSWENCPSCWVHKIISQPLEKCQVCIFLKLKSNLFTGQQTVTISEFAQLNYIVLRLKVCLLTDIWALTLNPKTSFDLTTHCNCPLGRKWGQGWGHFLHILLVWLLRRASNNSCDHVEDPLFLFTHLNTFVPLWEVLSGLGWRPAEVFC